MKINGTNSKSVTGVGRSSNSSSRPVRSADTTAALPPDDQAQISSLSAYLTAAISGSAAHIAKLGALSFAVANNSYTVDSSAVSEGIIQHSLLFGGAW
jgi:anti-sigma28 factor (negative regulator of flagellin synthesis)